MFNKTKGKIIYIFLLLIFSFSSINASANGTDLKEDCRSSAEYSAALGNQPDSNMTKNCSFYLTQNDSNFIVTAGFLVPKDMIDKYSDTLIDWGFDYENNKNKFKSTVVSSLMSFASIIIAICLMIYVFVGFIMSTGESPAIKQKTMFIGIALSSILLVMSGSTPVMLFMILIFCGMYNWAITSMIGIEDKIDNMSREDVARFSEKTVRIQNENITTFLIQTSLEELITDTQTIKRNLLSTFEYGKNGSIFSEGFLTVGESMSTNLECLSTGRVDVDTEFEFSVGNIFNSLDVGVAVSHNAVFSKGGDTENWDCDENFGDDESRHSVRINTMNALSNFLQQTRVENMAGETTIAVDIDDFFDKAKAISIQKIEESDLAGANDAVKNTGDYLLALAAVKQSNKTRTDIRTTSSYKSLVEKNKKDFAKQFDCSDGDVLTFPQCLHLQMLQKSQYKYSRLFGKAVGEDDITGESINGHYFIKPYLIDIAYAAIDYECALSNTSSMFLDNVEGENYFNDSIEKQLITKDHLKEIGTNNQLECYRIEDDGTITALGNPEMKDEIWFDMLDKAKALEIWLMSIDEGAFAQMTEKDNQIEKIKMEIANMFYPSMKSLYSINNAMIDISSRIGETLNAEQNLFTFNLKGEVDISKPQFYYNFDLYTNDSVDQKIIDNVSKSKSLRKYQFNPVLNNVVRSETAGVVNHEGFWDKLGLNDIINNLIIGTSCPIVNNKGECDSNIIQQSHANIDSLTRTAITATGIRLGMMFVNSQCKSNSGGGYMAVMGGFIGVGISLVKKAGCAAVESTELSFGSNANRIVMFIWFLTIINFMAANSYWFVTVFFLFYLVRTIAPMFLFLGVSTTYELIKNSIMSVSSDDPNKTFLNFYTTMGLIKSILFHFVMVNLSMYFFMFLITSGAIGGAIYDITRSMFDTESTFQNIIFGLVQPMINMLMFLYCARVVGDFERMMGQMASVRGENFFEGSSDMVNMTFVYASTKVAGALNQSGQEVAKGVEKGMSNIAAKQEVRKNSKPE